MNPNFWGLLLPVSILRLALVVWWYVLNIEVSPIEQFTDEQYDDGFFLIKDRN